MKAERPSQLPGATSRRDFLRAAGAAAAAATLAARTFAESRRKVRYAIVGAGHRGSGMWGAEALQRHGRTLELVGLCDVNPRRAEAANALWGRSPVFWFAGCSTPSGDRIAVCRRLHAQACHRPSSVASTS
jgi:hypothetical protein